MKRFIHLVCLLLVMATVTAVPAYAAEQETRGSSFFMTTSTYIDRYGKSLDLWFDVSAVYLMDELGARYIKVEESSDTDNWSVVETFRRDDYPNLICNKTSYHNGHVTYTGQSGYYYRIHVCYYAKSGQNIGEMDEYSSYVYIP